MISSEKSLVDLVALIKQFDTASSTLEVIKLTKACIRVYNISYNIFAATVQSTDSSTYAVVI